MDTSGKSDTVQTPPIPAAISRLDTTVQKLQANVERLEQKLSSVLLPQDQQLVSIEAKPAASPMENQLESLCDNLIAECDKLDNIIQRLQI